ncbi:aldo/keto reductase [Kribbella sp. NBC_00709]|uniref:aldo/keto reductase n=1 Tax=Kribbella sp. NBC_00709 TaxID=2975972 RepID=UPI002E27B1D9|nr:aldo/keto reductase [Kribbella sp. NBC_00709]
MKRRILGATGISVSDIALGAMMFGAMGNQDHEDSVRIIHRALDAGINLVDTADVYSGGESEEIVGTAIRGRRDDVVLASKFGLPMGADPNQRGASRRWIMQSVENSLRRLGTDHLDLYQLHRPDHDTDPAETLSALSDLVQAGKIRAFGSSMFPAETIVEAQWSAERHGAHRFLTEQTMYSILTRRPEASVFPVTQQHGLGVLTFSPLNSGWLSGRANPASSHRASTRPDHYDPSTPTGQAKTAAVAKLSALADEAGMTLPHLAIAFVRAHPAVTSVLIGPRTQEQLDSLLPAAEIELSGDILDRIDEIVAPGTELDPADNYAATPPAIEHAHVRRRS